MDTLQHSEGMDYGYPEGPIMAAVTVAVTMKVVGILLVSAMLVLPVATVQQVTTSFRSTVLAACLLGFVVSVGGLLLAYYLREPPPGATIVLSAIGVFTVVRLFTLVRPTSSLPSRGPA